MTLQWTFVATCLYIEVFIILLLMMPFISPPRWQTIFRSRIVSSVKSYANLYFNIFIFVLLLLFFESIREVRKYSEPMSLEDLKHHPEAETMYHMKLFRAQRNLYIAGFALLLWFLIRRLVLLIANEASLMAESVAARRQAESATEAARKMLDEKDNTQNLKKEEKKEVSGDEAASMKEDMDVIKAREQVEQMKEELYHARIEVETIKKQAESVNREYDRLLEEHRQLQEKMTQKDGAGDVDAKKDN